MAKLPWYLKAKRQKVTKGAVYYEIKIHWLYVFYLWIGVKIFKSTVEETIRQQIYVEVWEAWCTINSIKEFDSWLHDRIK